MAELLPLFPLGTVLFPGSVLPLQVFEPRYRLLVEDLLVQPEPRRFGVVAIREGHEVGADSIRSLHDVGCTAEVAQVRRVADGRYLLATVGATRFRLLGLDRSRAYLQATVELLDEPTGSGLSADRVDEVRRVFASYRALLAGSEEAPSLPDDPTALSYVVAAGLAVPVPERQALLDAPETTGRLGLAARLLARELTLIRDLGTVPLPQPPIAPGSLN